MRKGSKLKRSADYYKNLFLSKVYPEPNTGCWIWSGGLNAFGYGSLNTSSYEGFCNTSRYSYYIHKGDFDRSKLVLHHCDVRCCVNPDHLYIGNHKDNSNDKHSRGRADVRTGQNNGRSVLTNDQISTIRLRYKRKSKTDNAVVIAKEYGVSSTVIYLAVSHKTWKHL